MKHMVTEHLNQQKYMIGGLKPFVILIPFSNAVEYVADEEKTSAVSVKDTDGIIRIETIQTSLTSEEAEDGRLQFLNRCTAQFAEDLAIEALKVEDGKWRVVVEDMEGSQWLVNADFPVSFTHTSTFSDGVGMNGVSVDMTVSSNWPTLYVEEKITDGETLKSSCRFMTGKVSEFWMASAMDTSMTSYNHVIDEVLAGSFSDFKKIEPIQGTFLFTEQSDGERCVQSVKFSVPLSSYKHYWQYSLVEFADNRYTLLLRTDNGTICAAGFEHGMSASYVITTSQDEGMLNTIEITLSGISQTPSPYSIGSTFEDTVIEVGHATVLVPVEPFQKGEVHYETDVCIDRYSSMYIILEEQSKEGEKLGRYWVYEPYYRTFLDAGMNIVGTYTETDMFRNIEITHSNQKCGYGSDECKFDVVPDKLYIFSPYTQSHKFTLRSECDWKIEDYPDWIKFSVTEGEALSFHEVEMDMNTLSRIPDSSTDYLVRITSGENSYIFTVRYYSMGEGGSDCGWIDSDGGSINGSGGDVRFWLKDLPFGTEFVEGMLVSYPSGLSFRFSADSMYVKVPMNMSEEPKEYVLVMKLDERSEECRLVIQQSGYYTKRVVEPGYICDAYGNKYQKVAVYYGWNEAAIENFLSYERGQLLDRNSSDCLETRTRWVEGDGYICVGNEAWSFEWEEVSKDAGQTWERTGVSRQKERLAFQPAGACSDRYIYRYVDSDEWMCDGWNSYVVQHEQVSYDDGRSWHLTGEQQKGAIIRNRDPRCSSIEDFRWVEEKDGFICDGGDMFTVEKEQKSDDGVNWKDTGVTVKGGLIQSKAPQCEGEGMTEWKTFDDDFVCEGDTSYLIEYECTSYDGGETWVMTGETRRGEKILDNDKRCSQEWPEERYWGEFGECVEEDGKVYISADVVKQGSVDGENWQTTDERSRRIVLDGEYGLDETDLSTRFVRDYIGQYTKVTGWFDYYYRPVQSDWREIQMDYISKSLSRNIPTEDDRRMFEYGSFMLDTVEEADGRLRLRYNADQSERDIIQIFPSRYINLVTYVNELPYFENPITLYSLFSRFSTNTETLYELLKGHVNGYDYLYSIRYMCTGARMKTFNSSDAGMDLSTCRDYYEAFADCPNLTLIALGKYPTIDYIKPHPLLCPVTKDGKEVFMFDRMAFGCNNLEYIDLQLLDFKDMPDAKISVRNLYRFTDVYDLGPDRHPRKRLHFLAIPRNTTFDMYEGQFINYPSINMSEWSPSMSTIVVPASMWSQLMKEKNDLVEYYDAHDCFPNGGNTYPLTLIGDMTIWDMREVVILPHGDVL